MRRSVRSRGRWVDHLGVVVWRRGARRCTMPADHGAPTGAGSRDVATCADPTWATPGPRPAPITAPGVAPTRRRAPFVAMRRRTVAANLRTIADRSVHS